MADGCATPGDFDGTDPAYRRVLWLVIAINGTMFAVEMAAGFAAGSMALRADALDFLGDTATYALSLAVIGHGLAWRARAALVKGLSMAVLGLWILGATAVQVLGPAPPEALVMGATGILALVANVVSAFLLFRFRDGDANVRSVWLCSRNDAIGNIAVVIAAGVVATTGAAWPDLVVAAGIATLFLWSSVGIVAHARRDLGASQQRSG